MPEEKYSRTNRLIKYTDEQKENLISGIFQGSISTYNLPEELYKATADYLKKGLYKGWGKTMAEIKFGTPDLALVKQLRENIYIFSAAKTHSQVREMTDAIIKDDKVVPFAEFRKSADEIFQRYNEDWLRAEYNTAVGMARNAEAWQTFESEKEQFPMLKYNAVNDGNICEICEPLDGITLPVDDSFWDEFMPENHFNCRCLVEQYPAEEERTKETKVASAINETKPLMTETFMMNPGKDKVIFKEQGAGQHPYFSVVDKGFHTQIQRNFGLEIPQTDIDE